MAGRPVAKVRRKFGESSPLADGAAAALCVKQGQSRGRATMAQTSLARADRADRYSAAEWDARVALAACYRLVAHYRMTDLIYTHISARVPGHADQFLINPYGLMFDEITASSLVKIDLDGKVIEDTSH